MSLGKHVLNNECLRSIYFAHIHSHLSYGLLVWGSMMSTGQLKELGKIQKDCIDIILKGSCEEALANSRILSLEQMIHVSLCQLGYKLSHKLLPAPLQNIFDASGGKKVHRYPTRGRSTPNIQQHKGNQFNKSFLCQSIKHYSQLTGTLKNEPTLTRFTKNVKKYLLQK